MLVVALEVVMQSTMITFKACDQANLDARTLENGHKNTLIAGWKNQKVIPAVDMRIKKMHTQ